MLWLLWLVSLVHFGFGGTLLGTIDKPWNPMRRTPVRTTDFLVFDFGDTIELDCEGPDASMIEWTYPSSAVKPSELESYGQAVISNSIQRSTQRSTLRIIASTYRDTGRYECSCSGLAYADHAVVHIGGRVESKQRVYIYVRDPEHLFVQSKPREAIVAFVRKPLTLPCAVTDPEIKVTLTKHRGLQVEGQHWQYNDRQGFFIDRVSVRESGGYSCRAVKGNRTETKNILIHVQSSIPLLLEPLLTLRDNATPTDGDTVIMRCQVPVGKGQLTAIRWFRNEGANYSEITSFENDDSRFYITDVMRDDICGENREMCAFRKRYLSVIDEHYDKIVGRLRISPVKLSDSTTYFCDVWSSGVTRRSNLIDLRVLDKP